MARHVPQQFTANHLFYLIGDPQAHDGQSSRCRVEGLETHNLLTIAIDVGDHLLLANTADQWIEVSATSSDPANDPQVTGFNLAAQIGDGLGSNPEPVFQAISNPPTEGKLYGWDFRGGIWDAHPNTWIGELAAGAEQYAQSSLVLNTAGTTTPANGLIVRLHISTVGIASGTYDLKLKDTDIGSPSAFIPSGSSDPIVPVITNGHITIGVATLSIAPTDASKAEGNSATTPYTFTVTRTGSTSGTTSVNWAVTGSGTNVANAADFGGTLPAGTVNFAANDTSKTFTVDVSGDTTVEPDEGFTVTLSHAPAERQSSRPRRTAPSSMTTPARV